MARDPFKVAQTFVQPANQFRLRFGTVVSIQDDHTITVTVGGATPQLTDVKYLASFAPLPGATVILFTDGADIFAVDHLAESGRTLSVSVVRTTPQSIPDDTQTSIVFDSLPSWASDEWGCWSASNPTRLTAPITGTYSAHGTASYEGDSVGFRALGIFVNGTTQIACQKTDVPGNTEFCFAVSAQGIQLTKGDYLELTTFQDSNSAIDLVNPGAWSPGFQMTYLGP